ncbi:MAG TPA: phosphoribosylamine--glycine ligase [Ktedonobacteraceae bacterium]
MRVLVVGSGAREHALTWKLAQSHRVARIYAAPGNPGMTAQAACIPIGLAQIAELADFAERANIDLTVVGPEVPLVAGITDEFRQRGLHIFGPEAAGAALEGSKAFAKALMVEADIPTAQHRTFTRASEALAYLEQHGVPVVVKADGNAAGKGAIVALNMATAHDAIREIMIDRVFGSAGDIVVIEDYLQGIEIGATAICNGTQFLSLTLTQDHKRALDNDRGLNTGGMGAFTPLPFVNELQEQQIHAQIIAPTLNALKRRGIHFSGVLYSNIMLTERGPMVLEHNTRFGDPETQALMLLLQADLLDVLAFTENAQVKQETLWHTGYAVSLTLASGGYPGKYRTGRPIKGVEEADRLGGVHVFHAGTSLQDGRLVTAGGRVLSIAAHGETLQEAVARVYEAAAHISFEGMHYRRDIAWQAL